jgi:hypothetical protein
MMAVEEGFAGPTCIDSTQLIDFTSGEDWRTERNYCIFTRSKQTGYILRFTELTTVLPFLILQGAFHRFHLLPSLILLRGQRIVQTSCYAPT